MAIPSVPQTEADETSSLTLKSGDGAMPSTTPQAELRFRGGRTSYVTRTAPGGKYPGAQEEQPETAFCCLPFATAAEADHVVLEW